METSEWLQLVCSDRGPPPNVRLVLMGLASTMSEGGACVRPPMGWLGELAGFVPETVARKLAEAKEAGWLVEVPGGYMTAAPEVTK